ncbi:synaptic vesicle 2-related protein-like isoform X1 [Choristoneura fumiferana]|uniref:synaptic vesicle 2-related protein-like isoform X1 n=1 Tax=Choristoneura fumiferana TaxID=7141 RepID=UPI003D15D173
MTEDRKTEATPFEDALDKTGNGVYNILLVLVCAWILLAIGIDLFGFSLVVASACDLELTVTQKGILSSLPFVGILLVSYFWGYVSDTRGRRFSLVLSLQSAFVLSCLTSVSPNWLFLGLVKFFSVCFSCAANSATYTLVGESCVLRVRSKYMLLMTCLLLLAPAAAAVLTYPTLKLDFAAELTWLGVVFRPWRLLIVVLAVPSGIGGIAIYFFHESPKFLANCGRKEEALDVMKSIYAINQRCSRDDFKVKSLDVGEETSKRDMSLLRSMFAQSAPLFDPPLRWRTFQLFYIVAVVYITNNSFLVWLPQIFSLVMLSMESGHDEGNICSLIARKTIVNNLTEVQFSNSTAVSNVVEISPDSCLGVIEDNVILTLIASQSAFSFLNFIISYLPNHRRVVLLTILSLSSASGICCNLMPEPVASVFFFVVFTCTCLGMGILASYFVDLYPTSCRGMVACLSIMVGRSCTFIGINAVGNLIFSHCQVTFYLWSMLVLSSVVAAWFLPPDRVKLDVKTTAI